MNHYCDEKTSQKLRELGYDLPAHLVPDYFGILEKPDFEEKIHLYDAQQWLMTQGIHIAPRIYLYHDTNLDEQVSWECNIYAEWTAIFTKGKSLTYTDALLLGIKEAIKILTNNGTV